MNLLNCVLGLSVFAVSALPASDLRQKYKKIIALDKRDKVIAIFEKGESKAFLKGNFGMDFSLLKNGNFLYISGGKIINEINREGKVVWSYDCPVSNNNKDKKVKVRCNSVQRLPNGNTLIAESGSGRLIEVDKNGALKVEIKLQLEKRDPGHDTRLVRKTETGTYLVCQEGDSIVKEYNSSGDVVWEYKPEGHWPFGVLRLKNGNTLIATGRGGTIVEVSKDKKVAWRFSQKDCPDFNLGATTSLQVLENGNIIFGNCHAGKGHPQIVEINRKKEVLSTFYDSELLGNSTTNFQVITEKSSIR